METVGYIASICIGLVLGMLGGGGSILSIPILVYLFNIDAVMASAYSLFIVGATSLAGAIPKYREHLVNVRTGLIFGIPSIIAIFATRKWIIPSIPDVLFFIGSFALTKRILLLGIFAILMILASIVMIRKRGEFASDTNGFQVGGIMAQGVLIGFLTGLVGAGGGFLIIPALILLTGISFKTAVGTSLFIIAINSLIGFMGDVLNYSINWTFLFKITSLAIIGILVGNQFSKKLPSYKLRKSFGWFTLVTGGLMLIKEIFFP